MKCFDGAVRGEIGSVKSIVLDANLVVASPTLCCRIRGYGQ